MKRIYVGLTILMAVALLLAACASGSGSEDGMLDGQTWEAALQNAEYRTQWTPEGVVRLENGEYRAPAAPGSASEIVIALTEYVAVGELKGESAAAAILNTSGGGSGTFYELHLMVERNGQLHDVAWALLGDRVQINSLSIEDNEIVVDMVTHGPDDPMCCPTQQVVQTYALQGDALVQTTD
jgi:hypothetical protein